MCYGAEAAWLPYAISAAVTVGAVVAQAEDEAAQTVTTQANARIAADIDARSEEKAAEDRASIIRRQVRGARSKATQQFAAAGVDLSVTGSPTTIDESIEGRGESDAWAELLSGFNSAQAIRRAGEVGGRSIKNIGRQANAQAAATLLQSGSNFVGATGWGSNGPQQPAAPIESRTISING